MHGSFYIIIVKLNLTKISIVLKHNKNKIYMKVFYIKINEDDITGIDAISLVDMPAVQKNFLCFNKDSELVKLNFDNSKHIITGVVCLADTPIYRYNQKLGEYYVVFTKETIERMVEKFSKQDLFKSVNLQHDNNKFVDGIYMVESFITNKERGINPVEFADIPDGSWICSFKVENDELWNEIINGDKLNGFSLQGMFDLEEKFSEQKPEEQTFEDWVNSFLEKQ